MATPLTQSETVRQFTCLGDKCEDTCCKGWGMQLCSRTVDLYKDKAPELLESVTSGEAEHIMRRDEATDYCVKFEGGWCGIHAKYGEDFLGDACHFFPRVTRQLGEHTIMSASLSCPEIVRLGLIQGVGFTPSASEIERLPYTLSDYCPQELEPDKALALHQFFVDSAGDEAISAPRAMARLRSVAASLQAVDVASWGVAAPFYWNNADSRLPAPEANIADPFNLLNALQGLVGASKLVARDRLNRVIGDIEQALKVTLNWQTLGIETRDESLPAQQQMQQNWQQQWQQSFQPVLRRWLQAELSVMCFPFAGLGETLTDRASLLGVRFATLQLALMSACQLQQKRIDDSEVVRIVQSLARFLGHLAEPTLCLQIYNETGWLREARLRALVMDS